MKKLIGSIAIISALMGISNVSRADDNKFHGGFDLSVGAPSGAEVGFVCQPFTKWTRLELGLAYNAMSFGGMASATFTPIKFPVMPVLQVEGGFFPTASLPSFVGSGTLPSLGYDWFSAGPGLEFGNRDGVLFFLHPAITYIHLSTDNFQNVGSSSGAQIGNPVGNFWLTPTLRMGLSVLF